jgi:hypothetical protein
LIENCNWSLTDCAAISATGNKLKIYNNTCHTTGRSVIVHRFADEIEIKYNHLFNGGVGTEDLGITYTYKTNGNGAQIAYNWIHDNMASGTSTGIYLDNNDTAFVVHHNVVWNCKYGIQTNKNAIDHKIYNNTIFNCPNPSWAWGPTGTIVNGQKVVNNLSEVEFLVGNEFKNNVVDSKTCMINPGQFDFRLNKGAKAIDAGITHDMINKYKGNAPDAGAYEFGDKKWKAGSDIISATSIFPKRKR